MIKKNIIRLSSILLLLLLLVGCQKNKDDNTMSGSLSFGNISRINDTFDKDIYTKSGDFVFVAKVVDAEDKVYFVTEDLASIADQKISLPIGDYIVEVWTNNVTAAAFDTEVYYGTANITIENSKNTPVDIECKLDNVLVDVKYSQNIKDNFKSYSMVVANSNANLTFEQDDTRTGYFSYEEELSYIIVLIDELGDRYVYEGVVKDLNIRDFIHFNVDVKARTDKNDVIFDLIINTSIREVTTITTITLTPNATVKPTVVLRDKDIAAPIVIGEGVGADMYLDINAESGVSRVFVNFISGAPASFPKMLEVLKSDVSLLSSVGASTDLVEGSVIGSVNMTEMTRQLQSNEDGFSSVEILIGVYDDAYNLTTQKITINVVKSYIFTTAPLTTTDIDWSTGRGKTNVTFAGSWAMNETPEGLTFGYREVGEIEWTMVDEHLIVLDEPNKTYSVTLDLLLAKEYDMQAVSVDDAGKVLTFSTVRPAEPTNMNFDEWSQDGKTWFPYASGAAKDWDSGNGGLTSSLAGGKDSNTIPETVKVKKGKAVKLTSVEAPVVGFAAGNLFTGYFKFSLAGASNPLSMVHFGRPYAARPVQFKGYYAYNPAVINTGKEHDGETDQCNIYISLERWGDGVTERPANSTIIGTGDFRTSEANEVYKEFVVNIVYNSDEMPDHIVMVATSSLYGDQFIGGKGSVLYVDEFQLTY